MSQKDYILIQDQVTTNSQRTGQEELQKNQNCSQTKSQTNITISSGLESNNISPPNKIFSLSNNNITSMGNETIKETNPFSTISEEDRINKEILSKIDQLTKENSQL